MNFEEAGQDFDGKEYVESDNSDNDFFEGDEIEMDGDDFGGDGGRVAEDAVHPTLPEEPGGQPRPAGVARDATARAPDSAEPARDQHQRRQQRR